MKKKIPLKVTEPPKPLTPPPASPRGPTNRHAMNDADNSGEFESGPPPDYRILDRVIGRLWKSSPFAEPILGIEILDGPYKGVTFAYSEFHLKPADTVDGMVPTRYETEVLIVPPDLKDSFRKDEAFDAFTTELLIAWLGYISTNNLSPLIKIGTDGVH